MKNCFYFFFEVLNLLMLNIWEWYCSFPPEQFARCSWWSALFIWWYFAKQVILFEDADHTSVLACVYCYHGRWWLLEHTQHPQLASQLMVVYEVSTKIGFCSWRGVWIVGCDWSLLRLELHCFEFNYD